MNKPIITGILSYGMSGKLFHAPFVNAHSGFKLHAVTERTRKAAEERYPGIRSYDSVSELINDPEIELVIVNTPNNTHFEYAKEALQAGKHVLVEKPFAVSSKQAKELFELARTAGRKVMVYHNRRWDSDYLSLKKVLESGKLGNLIEAHFRFDRYRREIGPKVFKETDIPGSGVAYDLGSHMLDQAISLFGQPLKSVKVTGAFRENSQVDDYVSIHLMYPNRLNVFLTASLLVADPLPAYVMHGTLGSYIKDRTDLQETQLLTEMSPLNQGFGIEPKEKQGILTIVDGTGEKVSASFGVGKGNYLGLFDAVYAHIRENKPYPVKEEEIVWQMEILEQPDFV